MEQKVNVLAIIKASCVKLEPSTDSRPRTQRIWNAQEVAQLAVATRLEAYERMVAAITARDGWDRESMVVDFFYCEPDNLLSPTSYVEM